MYTTSSFFFLTTSSLLSRRRFYYCITAAHRFYYYILLHYYCTCGMMKRAEATSAWRLLLDDIAGAGERASSDVMICCVVLVAGCGLHAIIMPFQITDRLFVTWNEILLYCLHICLLFAGGCLHAVPDNRHALVILFLCLVLLPGGCVKNYVFYTCLHGDCVLDIYVAKWINLMTRHG